MYFDFVSLFGFVMVLSIGVAVYLSREKESINKYWFLLCASTSLWSLFFFLTINAPNKEASIMLRVFLDTFVIFICLFWLKFVHAFLNIRKNKLVILATLTSFAIFISNLTVWAVKDMIPKNGFRYYVEAGPGYYAFALFFSSIMFYGLFLLLRAQFQADSARAKQCRYVILASTLGVIGGGSAFLLSFNIHFPPYPFILLAVFPILIYYAITKHHLFNAKVIVTELLVFAMWIFLLLRTIVSPNYQEMAISGGLLLALIIVGILLIRSVIKEVRQREAIAQMAEDIKRAYITEKRAKEELEKLDKAKDQFLMTVQHDLRRPLTSAKWYLDLLVRGVLGKQSKEALEGAKKVQNSVENSIKEVNDFLDITQFQLGKGAVSLASGVKVGEIMEEITSELKPSAESKGIYLKMETKEELPEIKADRTKLRASLLNIIDNAVKYTNQGGVTIKIKNKTSGIKNTEQESKIENDKENKSVLIEIRDTGIGIPKNKVASLFETQFERTEQAKKTTAMGKGVGLYLAGQIIKAHNGRVWAESEGEGKGSAFWVELPAGA